jgi:hypothetical protein
MIGFGFQLFGGDMRGKKEEMRKGARQGIPNSDDLQLLRFILEEQPRLKERVIRYIEQKRGITPEKKRTTNQSVHVRAPTSATGTWIQKKNFSRIPLQIGGPSSRQAIARESPLRDLPQNSIGLGWVRGA